MLHKLAIDTEKMPLIMKLEPIIAHEPVDAAAPAISIAEISSADGFYGGTVLRRNTNSRKMIPSVS